jgi:hypothetical protein
MSLRFIARLYLPFPFWRPRALLTGKGAAKKKRDKKSAHIFTFRPCEMSACAVDVAKNDNSKSAKEVERVEKEARRAPLTAADLTKLRTFTFYASDFKNDKITFKDPGASLKDGAVLQWGAPKIPGYFDSFTQVVQQECNLKLIEAKARPCYLEFWNPEWLKRPNVAVIIYAWTNGRDVFVDCYYHAKDNDFVIELAKGLDGKLELDQFTFLEGQLLGYQRPFRVEDVTVINDYVIRWAITEKEEELCLNAEVVRVGEKPLPTTELDAQLKRWNAALYPRVCRYYIVPCQTKEGAASKKRKSDSKEKTENTESKEKEDVSDPPKKSRKRCEEPKRLARFLSTEILGSLVETWDIPVVALMKQAKNLKNQLDEVKEEGQLSCVLHGFLPFANFTDPGRGGTMDNVAQDEEEMGVIKTMVAAYEADGGSLPFELEDNEPVEDDE